MAPISKLSALIAMLTCSAIICQAQTKTSNLEKIFAQIGTGPATKSGFSGSFAVQSVWKNNLVATVGYQNISASPKNLPSDYENGYTMILLIPIADEVPEQQLNIFSLTMGKLFAAGRKSWFTTEGGIALVSGDKFSFKRKTVEGQNLILIGYQSSNYDAQKERKTGLGGHFKADFNWAFSSIAGLGVGAYANLNSVQPVVGAEIKFSVGWMNVRRKNK